ncbi:MAG: N-acetylneuraminate synthase [Holosporaceae bacterium]|jgi:N,N'-diacetyllegionaminate synthase|nr:N-acetylneuraminate synthase [Holosporaceae bacterium]
MDKVFIIAEAGVNHNGSVESAENLIDKAMEAGCDAVKFQTFKAENVVSRFAEKAEYQKKRTGAEENQLQMIKKLELSFDDFAKMKKYCEDCGVMFLSSPFDVESADFLASLDVEYFKIPSGEIVNLPLLRKIASFRKKVILSVGMATLEEIEAAVKVLVDSREIRLLHCTTEYPCPFSEVNLRAIQTLKNKFGFEVGYSDHTEGIEVAIAAVALGATVIEKHFTLDKNADGPDHRASLEPHELKQMVSAIRNIEKALGDGRKIPTESEIKNIPIVRKSVVAKRDIKKGEIFSAENLATKRPGTGISPMKWDEIMGTIAQRDYSEDELI